MLGRSLGSISTPRAIRDNRTRVYKWMLICICEVSYVYASLLYRIESSTIQCYDNEVIVLLKKCTPFVIVDYISLIV